MFYRAWNRGILYTLKPAWNPAWNQGMKPGYETRYETGYETGHSQNAPKTIQQTTYPNIGPPTGHPRGSRYETTHETRMKPVWNRSGYQNYMSPFSHPPLPPSLFVYWVLYCYYHWHGPPVRSRLTWPCWLAGPTQAVRRSKWANLLALMQHGHNGWWAMDGAGWREAMGM